MTSFPFNSVAKRFSLVAIVSGGKPTRTLIIFVDYVLLAHTHTIMAKPIKSVD